MHRILIIYFSINFGRSVLKFTSGFLNHIESAKYACAGAPSVGSRISGYRCMLVSLMVFILCSCQSTIIDRYSEDELVRIMLDAHTLGLIYNRQEVRTDSLKLAYYDVLEERYGLTREGFQELVEGLILNSELYDKVYEEMTGKVEKMEKMDMEEPYNSR